MKTYVYSRMEEVFYVVGVAGPGTRAEAFAELLMGERPGVFKHYDGGKPFNSMADKRIMYVERVGSLPPGNKRDRMRERAKARAEQVMAAHGENDMDIAPKKRRRKT